MNFLSDDEDVPSDSGSSNSVHRLTVNESFAKAFAYKKEREELAKCKFRSFLCHNRLRWFDSLVFFLR